MNFSLISKFARKHGGAIWPARLGPFWWRARFWWLLGVVVGRGHGEGLRALFGYRARRFDINEVFRLNTGLCS